MGVASAQDAAGLLDWKRRIFDLYAEVRAADDAEAAWSQWRSTRDEMFRSHPQSPLPAEQRDGFEGIDYFAYDSALRVEAEVETTEQRTYEIATSGADPYSFTRYGLARFELGDDPIELELYWLDGYGGGCFLPVADATSGKRTYGAGRYVLDTIKGADLGSSGDRLVLDFNFAYNPSCSYDPAWVCPLATPANRLSIAIEAGERYTA